MLYRRLGRSGLQVSTLSFGAWVTFGKQIGDPVAKTLLHTAYDAGINFFDNAETYADDQAEIVMGAILKNSGWRRSSFIVSSKVFFGWEDDKPNQTGLSRKHVIEGAHAALGRLQVDYLDLYYCHRPDPATPILETCRAMHDLITQGKVLYWGTSEWSAAELTEAFRLCTAHNLHAPVTEQPEYNLFHRARVETEFALSRSWPRHHYLVAPRERPSHRQIQCWRPTKFSAGRAGHGVAARHDPQTTRH